LAAQPPIESDSFGQRMSSPAAGTLGIGSHK